MGGLHRNQIGERQITARKLAGAVPYYSTLAPLLGDELVAYAHGSEPLVDAMGNLDNLQVFGGSTDTVSIFIPGLGAQCPGLFSLGSEKFYGLPAASCESLRIHGDISVGMVLAMSPNNQPADIEGRSIFGMYDGTSESADGNWLYGLCVNDRSLEIFHEYTEGIDLPRKSVGTVLPNQVYVDVLFTRESKTSTHRLYFNGELVYSDSYTNAPTHGKDSFLHLLRGVEGVSVSDFRIWNRTLPPSDASHLARERGLK